MSIELKVKSKSLSAEAVIIRKEERKALGKARNANTILNKRAYRAARVAGTEADFVPKKSKMDNIDFADIARMNYADYDSLNLHRINVVRVEARATFIARAYLAGATRKSVEVAPFEPYTKKDDQSRRFKDSSKEEVARKAFAMIKKYGELTSNEASYFFEWISS